MSNSLKNIDKRPFNRYYPTKLHIIALSDEFGLSKVLDIDALIEDYGLRVYTLLNLVVRDNPNNPNLSFSIRYWYLGDDFVCLSHNDKLFEFHDEDCKRKLFEYLKRFIIYKEKKYNNIVGLPHEDWIEVDKAVVKNFYSHMYTLSLNGEPLSQIDINGDQIYSNGVDITNGDFKIRLNLLELPKMALNGTCLGAQP